MMGGEDGHHGGRDALLSGQAIEPLKVEGGQQVVDLIEKIYAHSGFNARRLADACRIYCRMLEDRTTVALTMAGAMTPIGMSGPIIELIRNGFVDFIISTGANIYHDLPRPFDLPMVQGHWAVDDNALAEEGVARIYDVFITEDESLDVTDEVFRNALMTIPADTPISTAQLHHHLGRVFGQVAPHPEKSFLVAAAEHDVPVYTSSPADSSVAIAAVVPYIHEHRILIDPMMDLMETTAIVWNAEKNGVVELGGGSPKNFYLQTQPIIWMAFQKDLASGGHDYFIQLTTDAPHWGGLSGATPQEAKSWGKIKDAAVNNAVVYSCASITFPLLAGYVLSKQPPLPPKRLFGRRESLVNQFIEEGRRSPRLREQWDRAQAFLDKYPKLKDLWK